jgi:hypothetical protein
MKLSPQSIAKLLDLDIDHVIYKITGKQAISTDWKSRTKERASIRKQYKKELYELEQLPRFENSDAISYQKVCILRELIDQCNRYPITVMTKIVKCKPCVEKINFVGDYLYYDMILSEANQTLIKKKLAECHLETIGNDKIYEEWQSQSE